jgi:hypothetical protein
MIKVADDRQKINRLFCTTLTLISDILLGSLGKVFESNNNNIRGEADKYGSTQIICGVISNPSASSCINLSLLSLLFLLFLALSRGFA